MRLFCSLMSWIKFDWTEFESVSVTVTVTVADLWQHGIHIVLK
jgi:hypothetical protein